MLAKLIAVVIREVRDELRKLDEPHAVRQYPGPSPSSLPESPEPDPAPYQRDPASTTSADTERPPSWDHDKTPPVRAFGFGKAGSA